MKLSTQAIGDKFAIGLSVMCAVHCLLLPLLLVLLPSMAALQLDNEAFHFWMLIAVIPSSLYALTLGCKQHKRYQVFVLGAIGLCLLIAAVALGEARLGEMGEKLITVLGSGLIVIGHVLNFRLCHLQRGEHSCCDNE